MFLVSGDNSNAGIRELPPELGQLSNLWQLDIENLTITNVPPEIRKEGIGSMFLCCPHILYTPPVPRVKMTRLHKTQEYKQLN